MHTMSGRVYNFIIHLYNAYPKAIFEQRLSKKLAVTLILICGETPGLQLALSADADGRCDKQLTAQTLKSQL